ncbi:MAG: hypothetical protein QXP56_06970, partial [Archaeoglobaceae archaeon]
KFNCLICGKNFTSSNSHFEHLKQHVGKLSEESYRYLISLGVANEKIIEFCRANGIQLDARITHSGRQLSLEGFA